MSSIIKSDNGVSSGVTGIVQTADSSGQLALQTTTSGGSAVTALTLNNSQQATFANTINVPNTFGFKNRIINGAMVIDQRNNGASVTPSSGNYLVDRFQVQLTQASKFTAQQNAGSVTPPTGFTNYLGFTSSSAYSIGSGDLFDFNQRIEGYNVSDLGFGTANAKTVTLSFWVYSSLTGTFGGALGNGNGTRSYPFTYSVPTANTWTQISITIAGDTSGTWYTNNSIGLQVIWSLGSGSTYSGTAGAWASANYTSATGAVSVVGTSGATFYITGVQLEVGTQATSFDYRPYTTELQLCQRYYWKNIFTVGVGPYTVSSTSNGSNIGIYIPNPVYMRASPTTATSISNSNYDSSGPTSGNWVLNQPYTQNATKTGTVVVNSIGDATGVFFSFTGATFSVQPTGINGNGVYISASSEL